MINVLFGLPFITVFFMVLVQTAVLGQLPSIPFQLDNLPTCKTLKCPTDRVCVQMEFFGICGIREGQPCSFKDVCEGGYFCPDKNTCTRPELLPLNASCNRQNCESHLYCNMNQGKCVKRIYM